MTFTLNRNALASARNPYRVWLLLTYKNSDFVVISVSERSGTASISKVERHLISERFDASLCQQTCTVLNLLFQWSTLICTSTVFRDRGIVMWQSLLFSQLIKTIFQIGAVSPVFVPIPQAIYDNASFSPEKLKSWELLWNTTANK